MNAPDKELPVATGDIVADKYRVERLVGRGGMGSVFQATHVQLLQRVALKFLSSAALRQDEARTRFLREARAAAALSSDHVARVIDVGVLANGVPFLVIEYLEGEDLAARVARGPLDADEAVRLMIQACDALGEAHRLGIVHRDVKPHNLFLVKRPSGAVALKVLDFGIAKVDVASFGADVITGTCAVMGTPQYMAPEQMTSTRSVDAAADVWALGVCLYEALSGRRPFESSNMLELGALVMNGNPTPITAHRRDLPTSLVAVIERCFAKDPSRRFANANELGKALASAQEKAAIVVAPPTLVTPQFIAPQAPPSPRHSAPPMTPQLPTATSFGDPSVERPSIQPSARPSTKTSTSIGLALLALVVVAAIFVKVVHRNGEAPSSNAAAEATTGLVAPPPPPPTTTAEPMAQPTLAPTASAAPIVSAVASAAATTAPRTRRGSGAAATRPKSTTQPTTPAVPTSAPAER